MIPYKILHILVLYPIHPFFFAVFAQVTLEFEDDLQPGICELPDGLLWRNGEGQRWVGPATVRNFANEGQKKSVGPTTVGGLSFQKQFGGAIEELLPGNTWMNQMHSDAIQLRWTKTRSQSKHVKNRNDVWETLSQRKQDMAGLYSSSYLEVTRWGEIEGKQKHWAGGQEVGKYYVDL